MNCHDFERIWDDVLDAGRLAPGGRGPGMESFPPTSREEDFLPSLREHAFGCPVCQLRMPQLETLRRAIQSWQHAPKPSPSTDLVERILSAAQDQNANLIPSRNRRLWSSYGIAGIAAAAAALMIALYPWNSPPRQVLIPAPNGQETPPRVDLLALNQAFVDASEATWDLAYTASAPAVRLGRRVFDGPEPGSPEAGTDESSLVLREALLPTELPGEVVSEVLSRFGEEISAGVRPLSESARRALKYLQDAVPPPGEAIRATPPADTKGT